MTERPERLDDLLDYVAERVDPVDMARIWCEELKRLTTKEAQARRQMVGALLDVIEDQRKRLERFETNLPLWGTGTPEQWDAWLRDLPSLPDDRRLAFYQWIGRQAVTEALDEVSRCVGDDPVPVEARHYDQDAVYEFLEVADPRKDGGPFPVRLPVGLPFCDVAHHVHTHGGDRLPSCRLDSEE